MKEPNYKQDRASQQLSTEVVIGGLRLKNPVIAASGTFGYGREFSDIYDLSILGGVSVKGITLKPREGNPSPRIYETPAGMLNSIGLQNPGIDKFVEDELPFLREYDVAVIVNISGATIAEYGEMARILDTAKGISALEVNVSCPNVAEGGIAFGTNPKMIREVTESVKENTGLPVIVKLSPNVGNIASMAKAAEEAGADSVSLINTLLGMAIDIDRKCPALGNVKGGLSGPAIKPVALRMVWDVYEEVTIPIIGLGGIVTTEDALEFIMAGASAIQVGTGNFIDPNAMPRMVEGVQSYLKEDGYRSICHLIGVAHG